MKISWEMGLTTQILFSIIGHALDMSMSKVR